LIVLSNATIEFSGGDFIGLFDAVLVLYAVKNRSQYLQGTRTYLTVSGRW